MGHLLVPQAPGHSRKPSFSPGTQLSFPRRPPQLMPLSQPGPSPAPPPSGPTLSSLRPRQAVPSSLRPGRPRPAPTSSYYFPRTAPRLPEEPLGPRQPGGAGAGRAPLTLCREAGSCCGGSSACASLPLPAAAVAAAQPPGLLTAGPGPAPLHLVPHSGLWSPVSCIDPEAALSRPNNNT